MTDLDAKTFVRSCWSRAAPRLGAPSPSPSPAKAHPSPSAITATMRRRTTLRRGNQRATHHRQADVHAPTVPPPLVQQTVAAAVAWTCSSATPASFWPPCIGDERCRVEPGPARQPFLGLLLQPPRRAVIARAAHRVASVDCGRLVRQPRPLRRGRAACWPSPAPNRGHRPRHPRQRRLPRTHRHRPPARRADDAEHARWRADTPIRNLGTPDSSPRPALLDRGERIVGETLDVDGGLLMD